MRKTLTLVLFILFPICIFAQGFNSVHSPDGVNIFAVGDAGRIYHSSNSGNKWYTYFYTSNNLKCINTLGGDVWFAGDSGKIYKTNLTISGVSIIYLGVNFTINSIFFVDSNIGFLCGEGGRVYKSINNGNNWNLMNSGIATVKLNSISFKDSQNGIVVGDNGKVYMTIDGGLNWTLEAISTNRNLLKAKYLSDGIGVVGEFGTILLKTSIFSWAQVNSRTNSDIRGITGSTIDELHLCGGGGFIRNNKNGIANFSNFEINPMIANLVDVFYYGSNLGFAVSSLNKAIIKTSNGGSSWELTAGTIVSMNWVVKSPTGNGIGNNLCQHPTDRKSAFVVYGNKVFASRDKSETWSQIATIGIGSRAHSFYVSPVDTNIWLAAMENSPDCIVRSTNYGATWTNIIARDFSTYGQPLEMDQNSPNIFYFAPSNSSGQGIYKSINSGETFELISPYNNSAISQPCDLIVKWDHPNELYMGDDGADIWKSTDGAVSWTIVKPGSSSEVPSMCNSVFQQDICYATTWSSSQVFKTLNSGENWNIISNNSGSGWASDVCREDPTLVLTGNYGAQAYLSTNSGVSFFNVNSGLAGAGAGMMVPERNCLLDMQTGSLYKLDVSYATTDSGIHVPPSPPISSVRVNLKAFAEGFYYPLFNQLSRNDTFKVYLRNAISPYSLLDSSIGIIDSLSLSCLFTFYNAPTGIYFIIAKHLNSIETWSKAGGENLVRGGTVYNYDFTTAGSQAYGNNLKLKGSKYCLYSGDVNQDGFITLFDVIPIYNDATNFVTGNYLSTDLTGDKIVDLTDVTICYNNSLNFIRVRRP